MRAPVYRFIDAKNRLLGLGYPGEALVFLTGLVASLNTLPIQWTAGLSLALYLVLRLAGRGRSENFVQHWILWRVRQARAAGCLSAIARAPAPPFPFARAVHRDVPPRSARG